MHADSSYLEVGFVLGALCIIEVLGGKKGDHSTKVATQVLNCFPILSTAKKSYALVKEHSRT